MRFDWKALIALLISIGGLASHPELLNIFPEKVSIMISVIGVIAQGFTKELARKDYTRNED